MRLARGHGVKPLASEHLTDIGGRPVHIGGPGQVE